MNTDHHNAAQPDPHHGGWTAQRLAVIADAAGICSRCGASGADTAIRRWPTGELRAAHTRCALGIGPPPAHPDHAA